MAASLPKCALACLGEAIANSTCNADDQACICTDEALNIRLSTCIRRLCTVREALFTQNVTASSCNIEANTNFTYEPVLLAFLGLAAIVVAWRFVARVVSGVSFWWDDYANLGAMMTDIIFVAVIVNIKPKGFGVDIWAVPPENIPDILIVFLVGSCLYAVARVLIRLSILFFYLRIFRVRQARIAIWITLVVVLAQGIAFFFASLLQCTPVSYFWLHWDGEHQGHCIDARSMVWASAIVGIVQDVWFILLPIPFIIRLQLPLKKKLLVASMFAVGIIVVVISSLRLPAINKFTNSDNPTLDWVPIALWSGLEHNVGVICACLPSLQVLFKKDRHWRTKKSTLGDSASSGRGLPPRTNRTDGRKLLQSRSPGAEQDFDGEYGAGIQLTTTIQQHTSIHDPRTEAFGRPNWDNIAPVYVGC
ncbi:hypothetical protein F4780DRAFT_724333 [Xylariomycetidae sp. FL0641]|nr:hypothetical protein F4780DRAFT_724333 [Xylariomycetidae sp. FL0641]